MNTCVIYGGRRERLLTAGCLYCRMGADMWVFDTMVCNIMGTFYYEGLRKWHLLRLRMRKK